MLDKRPGQWYGPQTILQALHACNKTAKKIGFVVCFNGNVFLDKIERKIHKSAVFVGIPLRLGLDNVNAEYLACLKQMFDFR